MVNYADEQNDYIKKLWSEGLSAAQMAIAFAAKFDTPVTRNAMLGKVHRLGLVTRGATPRGARVRRRHQATVRRPREPRAPSAFARLLAKATDGPDPLPKLDDPADFDKLVPLMKLEEGQCRWPIGDPKQGRFGFCGCKKEPGLSYCAPHALRAYQPPTKPKHVNPGPGDAWDQQGKKIKVKERV